MFIVRPYSSLGWLQVELD
jgi:hypothetical protein